MITSENHDLVKKHDNSNPEKLSLHHKGQTVARSDYSVRLNVISSRSMNITIIIIFSPPPRSARPMGLGEHYVLSLRFLREDRGRRVLDHPPSSL